MVYFIYFLHFVTSLTNYENWPVMVKRFRTTVLRVRCNKHSAGQYIRRNARPMKASNCSTKYNKYNPFLQNINYFYQNQNCDCSHKRLIFVTIKYLIMKNTFSECSLSFLHTNHSWPYFGMIFFRVIITRIKVVTKFPCPRTLCLDMT